ncbi:dUTP diphosphatase [Bacillus infantis]|uniref:dUTP diphosphatase n=1 Tax=Bacillus infantis TaxID=324767 RepID=UPI00200668BC|nr:dUTP diphosphatase [Bacillus infantis]MCK6203946.1 dUTP diphosphatase [Bacillus infantis]
MNLAKLFEVQKVLRDRIGYNEPDRFDKLVLALLVEVGECANEWRGFKFWSKQQTPKTYGKFKVAEDGETLIPDPENEHTKVLEEYVDGLHFVLELGIEKDFDQLDHYPYLHEMNIGVYTETNTTEQFMGIYHFIHEFNVEQDLESYEELFLSYIGLGKHLGFTWDQIEQAYMDKNKVNHQRQEEGY